MSFTNILFWLILLPSFFICYYIIRKNLRIQNCLLLIFSVFFYACYDVKYVIFLAISICITYSFGLLYSLKKYRKCMWIGVLLNLSILLIFKYTTFLLGNINLVLNRLGYTLDVPDILLPVGLSFFIFQSTSYLFDIQKGTTIPEKNIINYALFVSFFPTITSGPIQRSYCLLPQIRKKRIISYKRFQEAVYLFLWGAFLKMVLADRLALFTNTVFDNYASYEGFILLVAAALYSIQIYADFAGYSYMAIGIAHLLGFDLPENFRQPYLAITIADFWRRWHISLTSWFTEYLYIPLGGNRKGAVRRYINIAIVFLVSGLWHGASWNFVLWGAIHSIYQIAGKLTLDFRYGICDKLNIRRDCMSYRLWQRIFIFMITTFAWIFFRSPDLSSAIGFLCNMFKSWNPWVLFDHSLEQLGLGALEWQICFWALIVVVTISYMREKKYHIDFILKQNLVFRYFICAVLFFSIIIVGIYGPEYSANAFIYAGF